MARKINPPTPAIKHTISMSPFEISPFAELSTLVMLLVPGCGMGFNAVPVKLECSLMVFISAVLDGLYENLRVDIASRKGARKSTFDAGHGSLLSLYNQCLPSYNYLRWPLSTNKIVKVALLSMLFRCRFERNTSRSHLKRDTC
eukprot:scpid35056/ scgid26558/ 